LNFAVVGATALDVAFFEERGINIPTNYSLRVQLDWFKEILPFLCNTSSKCNDMFERSLFLMGEFGGNDYTIPFFLPRTLEEIRTFVPLVIKAISSAIKELIDLGAVTLVVPGSLPMGCSAAYLTYYETADKEEYEPSTGCLKWLNKFAEYHNEELQKELSRIQALHPHTNIIYADYYNAAMRFFFGLQLNLGLPEEQRQHAAEGKAHTISTHQWNVAIKIIHWCVLVMTLHSMLAGMVCT